MTMFFDDEIDGFFKKASRSFVGFDSIFENLKQTNNSCSSKPLYYGYTMTVGPDGNPVVKEFGNVKPQLPSSNQKREPLVDTIVDKKENVVKLIAEIPGVEKSDIKIVVENKAVNIEAEHGEKKYDSKIPLKYKVDQNSAKASYTNGILELRFKLLEEKKPKGKTVEVE